MQDCAPTPQKDEPHSQGHCERRITKDTGCRVHIPILDGELVSPPFLVPKKNGKQKIFIDYCELYKATNKDHFPFPFIDHVLDGLKGKNLFSLLDGFNGYNQIQISLEYQDKTAFACPWGIVSYRVLPFDLCNAHSTFQTDILNIFVELVHDFIKIYMDDFIPYGCVFHETLSNLYKSLKKCIEMNLIEP